MQIAAVRLSYFLGGIALLSAAAISHSDSPIRFVLPGASAVIAENAEKMRYIVRAESAAAARENVTKVGGAIAQEFDLLDSVSAELTESQVAQLRSNKTLKLYEDRALITSSPTPPG